jgi:ABC-type phosphate transport system substrate-binding protein
MRYPAFIAFVLVVAVAAASARVTVAASQPELKIIVHPHNPVMRIERDRLRNIYLKKVVAWPGTGDTIRPIDLSPKLAARDLFTRKVLKKTPAQLKAYWNQQIFSGKGVPPPQVDRAQDAVAFVLANPSAIAYVPAQVDHGDAKVIEVE